MSSRRDLFVMPRTLSAAVIALLLLLAACGGTGSAPTTPAPPDSSSPATPSNPGGGVELAIATDTGADLKFDPAAVTVPAGATVSLTFENRATVPHNLTFSEPLSAATSTVVSPGASETVEFTAPDPGTYDFVCTLHPGMSGTLTVE
jgi:plastocyanin